MLALVTGASSGIGKDMAEYLSEKGYDLIITSRDEEKLLKLKNNLKTNVKIVLADLSKEDEVYNLYNKIKNEDVDLLVNDAGFGVFGEFVDTSLEKEINMIKVNDIAMHILMKLILKDMVKKNKGHILNVASIAGFMPGPLMATYYATKAYMLCLTRSVSKELKKAKSNVSLSVLCPGPIQTDFFRTAGVKFSVKPLPSEYVAKYAIDKTLQNKLTIIPGLLNKCAHVGSKIAPSSFVSSITYRIQKAKQ